MIRWQFFRRIDCSFWTYFEFVKPSAKCSYRIATRAVSKNSIFFFVFKSNSLIEENMSDKKYINQFQKFFELENIYLYQAKTLLASELLIYLKIFAAELNIFDLILNTREISLRISFWARSRLKILILSEFRRSSVTCILIS